MKKLEQDLAAIKNGVVEMGELVASMIELAARGLRERDVEVLDEVVAKEDRVNRMQIELDREAVRMLTIYSPVAGDLRLVLMITRIVSQLERMADQAVNMVEYLQLLASGPDDVSHAECHRMAKLVLEMLRDGLQAFFYQDGRKAQEIMARDDLVDALNHEVLRRGLNEERDNMSRVVAQILLARALERIGDQATNICEEVIFIVSGQDIRHQALSHH